MISTVNIFLVDVIITIEDKQDNYKEVVREKNIINKKHFSYADSLDVLNDVRIFNNGITIFRKDEDHETFVVLRDKPYIKVKSSEGSILFSIKELALSINNDIISIGYYLNDSFKQIKIEFIGD